MSHFDHPGGTMLVLIVWLADAQAPVWAYIIGAVATILWLVAPSLLFGQRAKDDDNVLWDCASLVMWPVLMGSLIVMAFVMLMLASPALISDGVSALLQLRHKHTPPAAA